MKSIGNVLSVLTVLTVINLSSLRAQDPPEPGLQPTKVTGAGIFEPYLYPSHEARGQFAICINPDKKADRKSPQAVVSVDGPVLRSVWGGPLVIKGDPQLDQESWPCWYHWPSLRPEDLKPAQAFPFIVQHPLTQEWVVVWVFAHDNHTPGFKPDDPNWSDWFTVWIEPTATADGDPFTGDELYVACGILVSGNIMDHRK